MNGRWHPPPYTDFGSLIASFASRLKKSIETNEPTGTKCAHQKPRHCLRKHGSRRRPGAILSGQGSRVGAMDLTFCARKAASQRLSLSFAFGRARRWRATRRCLLKVEDARVRSDFRPGKVLPFRLFPSQFLRWDRAVRTQHGRPAGRQDKLQPQTGVRTRVRRMFLPGHLRLVINPTPTSMHLTFH